MKAVKFKQQNCTYAEDQPEYSNLPAFKDQRKEGYVITCWKLSFWERVRILFRDKLWLNLMTFHNPLQPIFMSTKKSDVLKKKES